MKIRVSVPFESYVQYAIEVNNPHDLDEIKGKLESMDPSNWESVPDFYEQLGSDWRYFIAKVTLGDIEAEE